MSFRYLSAVVLSLFAARALAESHTVTFVDNCHTGTPMLVQNGNVLSTGAPFTSNGPLAGAIAFYQNGGCGENGEDCTLIELSLIDGGAGSSAADISLIPPHAFNVAAGFDYTGSGASCGGASCGAAGCDTAFMTSTDTCVQVGCSADEDGLQITFCGVGTGFTAPGHPTSPC